MKQRLRERETSDAKGAASAADKIPPQTPMDRFRSLARKLVRVPRAEIEEERRRHGERRDKDTHKRHEPSS